MHLFVESSVYRVERELTEHNSKQLLEESFVKTNRQLRPIEIEEGTYV